MDDGGYTLDSIAYTSSCQCIDMIEPRQQWCMHKLIEGLMGIEHGQRHNFMGQKVMHYYMVFVSLYDYSDFIKCPNH